MLLIVVYRNDFNHSLFPPLLHRKTDVIRNALTNAKYLINEHDNFNVISLHMNTADKTIVKSKPRNEVSRTTFKT